MANKATALATGALAVLGGVAGGAGYSAIAGDDDSGAQVAQAPLTQGSTKPTNENVSSGALTPAKIYEQAAPGVVLIQATIRSPSSSPFGGEQQGQSTGTGFVVSKDGSIVTNAHVVQGATTATVQFGSDKEVEAKVMGTDVNSDLAVLKIDPKDHDLKPLPLGSTAGLAVGDPVVAIGNPFGLDRTLTTGVVSAMARRIEGLNGFTISNVVQTDAAINKGNSGGPLLDSQGRVIGVNSQIQTETGGNVGIGFAVPVERLKTVLPTLEAGEEVKVAFFGVTTISVNDELSELGIKADNGLLVASVEEGSGADKAGISAGRGRASVTIQGTEVPLGGDIILKVDGQAFDSPAKLADFIADKKVGDKVKVLLQRRGEERTVTVTLGARPTSIIG